MKSFFLVVALAMFVAVQALTDDQKALIKSNGKKCLEETEADIELIKKLRQGDWSMENAKLKSYTFCMLKKAGVMNEDGAIFKDVAVSKSAPKDQQKVIDAMDKCMQNVSGATHDETAWNLVKCYQAENPDHGIY